LKFEEEENEEGLDLKMEMMNFLDLKIKRDGR